MAAATAESGDAGLLPLCFVLMPFGTKDDPSGAKVHFDEIYDEVIRPAITDAGMRCVRADEQQAGGIIHKPMFERLILCDYAVARSHHRQRQRVLRARRAPRREAWATTVLLFAADGTRLPFDLAPLRTLRYRLGPDGQAGGAGCGRRKRQPQRKTARRGQEGSDVDSPIYPTGRGLQPPT